MEFRKATDSEIVAAAVATLEASGHVGTQGEMQRRVLARLHKEDGEFRLGAERMRRVMVHSGRVKLDIRTRSVGAAPEPDDTDLRRMGMRYDPVVKRWRRVREGDDLTGHHHHRGEFAAPGVPCPVCREPLAKVHNATLSGGRGASGGCRRRAYFRLAAGRGRQRPPGTGPDAERQLPRRSPCPGPQRPFGGRGFLRRGLEKGP